MASTAQKPSSARWRQLAAQSCFRPCPLDYRWSQWCCFCCISLSRSNNLALQARVAAFSATKAIVDESSTRTAIADVTAD